MIETWMPVAEEGFENLYEVSDLGRVRRTATGKVLRPALVGRRRDEGDGYHCVRFCKDAKGKGFRVHRLVARVFVPGDPSLHVNHKDGNKINNTPSNLEWVSNQNNLAHARETGLWTVEKHGPPGRPRVLTSEHKQEILRRVGHHSMYKIARELALNVQTVYSFVKKTRKSCVIKGIDASAYRSAPIRSAYGMATFHNSFL